METNNLTDESITLVNEYIEHLQKTLKLRSGSNPSAYVGSTKSLLHIISTQEVAMKHFTSSTIGGIPLIVSVLEHTQDIHVKQIIVMIIKEMLLRKTTRNERTAALATSGAVNPLLKLVVKSHQPFNFSDDFVSALYSVTAKIGKKDKKFAMKARLLGVLPVITTHMRFYALRPKVLNSVLMLLKRVLVSAVNAIQLSKADLIPHLLSFLDTPKKKMTLSVMYTLEAISLATRSRYAARQFVKKEVTDHLVQVFLNASHSPGASRVKLSRMIRAYNAVLHTLIHMTQIKSGRESICSARVVPTLVNWCKGIASNSGSHWDRMVMRASIIVQRCLPPRPLPVAKFNSAIVFNLPDQKLTEEFEYAESKNDASDSDSQVSSNSSSFESDGDSDQDSDPFADNGSMTSGECARQFRSFFDELKEEKEIKSLLPNPSVYYEENVEFEEPLVFVTHEPKPSGPHSTAKNEARKPFTICNKSRISPSREKSENDVIFEEQSSYIITDGSPCSRSEQVIEDGAESLPSKLFSCINISKKKKNEEKCSFTSSEVRNLVDSAKEEKRSQAFLNSVNTSKLYQCFANRTVSVLPFVKVAYPDMKCCMTPDVMQEMLYRPPPGLARNHVLKHMEEMTNRDLQTKDIYNLDSLLCCETHLTAEGLTNDDEERIKKVRTSDHLLFESRFESGNLRKVIWKNGTEYDLILNPDVNSKNHHQWFYFQVSETVAGTPYVFNVINMEKTTSLFNNGMRPVIFSVKNYVLNKQKWMRVGSNICYYRNHYIQGASTMSSLRDKPYYTLTFTVTFTYDNDVCYIAYHYPYTYSALQTHIDCWLGSYDTTSVYCKRDELCKTLAGNSVPLLTITAKPVDGHRPYIFLTARVHPGESNSSWAMKGSLDYLLSNKPSAHRLREMYIFKVVPMLNPDGVINGCHRCSLSGQDLNRQWITPNPKIHPPVYYTKSLFYYLNSMGRKPLVFCDYHGHSRRHNVFLYGCNPEQSWWSNDVNKPDCESFKIIPVLMYETAATFCLDGCNFNVERSRESTARVTIWRQFDVALSYTMECTYGGCDQGMFENHHLGIFELEQVGKKLCTCFTKIMPSYDKNETVLCTVPINTSMLSKSRTAKTQEAEHADSFSSSLSEDDLVEYDETEQERGK